MRTTLKFACVVIVAGFWLFGGATAALATGPAEAATDVTFTADVAPILQRSCQRCHRPESVAPISFITYEDDGPARATSLGRPCLEGGRATPLAVSRHLRCG